MNKHKQFIKDAYNGEFGSMCSEWKETILKSYPEFEEVEFKVGEWVYFKCPLVKGNYARILKPTINTPYAYFNVDIPYNSDGALNVKKETTRKATKEEIEKHLIEEAKRRGFKEGVIYYGINNLNKTDKILSNLKYYEGVDQLTDGCGGSVYLKGKWAKIIETITKEEAEKQLGKTII